ncbi:MAG TPA: hypothetical protein VGN96_00010 [Roseococcus sp.]|jgi:hypothetical protein|nr:hypothetical protein [Roseococcus sp.]
MTEDPNPMLVNTAIPLADEIDQLGQRDATPTPQQMVKALQMHRGKHQPYAIAAATGLTEIQVSNIIRSAQPGPKKRPAVRRR